MSRLRTIAPILVIGAASLTFIGVSAALEGDDPVLEQEETTTTTTGCADDEVITDDGVTDDCDDQGEDTDGTDGDDPDDGDDGDDDGVEPDNTEAPPATHPDNHGAAVSQAAHECPAGPEHGACVREVARDKGDDAPSGEGEDAPVEDETRTAAPGNNGNGNGKGNGGGNGKGHAGG